MASKDKDGNQRRQAMTNKQLRQATTTTNKDDKQQR
jgi:hypothetical protein